MSSDVREKRLSSFDSARRPCFLVADRRRSQYTVHTVNWPGLIATCIALGALGAAADQLLKSTLKHQLYDSLLAVWSWLEDSRIADLPSAVAGLALDTFRIRRASRSKSAVVVEVLLISVALTALSAIVGRLVRRYTFPWYEGRALAASVGFVDATVIHTRWLYARLWHYLPTFLVNLAFDAATVITTLYALRVICRVKSVILRYGIILVALGTALLLAIGSLGVAHWIVDSEPPFSVEIEWAAECVYAVLTWNTARKFASGFDDAFVGMSTLIPVSTYLAVLACAIQARTLLVAMRRASLYWLELATEPLPKEIDARFKPFTLAGLVFGSFGMVAKLLFELTKR